MIAGFKRGHAGAHFAHDAGTLVAEDRREDAFRVGARQRVGVGVADAGGLDLDQHLAGFRPFDVDGLDGQRFAGLPGYRGAGFHRLIPPFVIPVIAERDPGHPLRCTYAVSGISGIAAARRPG